MVTENTLTFDIYDRDAESLAARYESKTFEQVHEDVLDLVPDSDGIVLDIGAGSGRDAAWFACPSQIFMQPSEDRHGEGRGRPGIQQCCRDPLLVRNDHLARRYSGTGVLATDGINPNTTTLAA